jgi:hypothetical protein
MKKFCYVISITGPNRPNTGKDGDYVASFWRSLLPSSSGCLMMEAAGPIIIGTFVPNCMAPHPGRL